MRVRPISELAKKKESVVFAIADTGEVWQVVIKSIKRGRSIMDKGGLHFRQSFHGGDGGGLIMIDAIYVSQI